MKSNKLPDNATISLSVRALEDMIEERAKKGINKDIKMAIINTLRGDITRYMQKACAATHPSFDSDSLYERFQASIEYIEKRLDGE